MISLLKTYNDKSSENPLKETEQSKNCGKLCLLVIG